ncbi:hypothetical protein FGG08_004323 [Glutinoglossum americanum]|uniref:Uncharacterized protein n=1 Tax=Glutinoglossum americanum TaxID=1670608 RepID=A0A9P8I0Q6_9PEZI|nr:hypothetical protein FGG08_004323 [Glutinoglossum americanum]
MPKKLCVAVKNRHWMVVLTIGGNLLWLLMIVFSTSLFLENNVNIIDSNAELLVLNQFDGRGLEDRFNFLPPAGNIDLPDIDVRILEVPRGFNGASGVDSRVLSSVVAFNHPDFELGYPLGTTPEYATQSFASSDLNLKDRSPSAMVDVFSSDLECEVGRLDSLPELVPDCGSSPSSPGNDDLCNKIPAYILNITTPSCQVVNASIALPGHTTRDKKLDQGYYGGTHFVECLDDSSSSEDLQYRLLVTLVWSSSSESTEPAIKGGTRIGPPAISMVRSNHLLCKPSYSIHNALVTVPSTIGFDPKTYVQVQDINDASKGRTLDGLSQDNFTALFGHALQDTSFIERLLPANNGTIRVSSSLRVLMLRNPAISIEDLFDQDVLEREFRATFRQIAAQLAKYNLLRPANAITRGSLSHREDRVVVSQLSFGLVQGAFALIYIFLGVFMFNISINISRWSLPRDPDSMAATSVLLKDSRELLDRLEPLSHLRRTGIRKEISDQMYQIRASPGADETVFAIEPSETPPGERSKASRFKKMIMTMTTMMVKKKKKKKALDQLGWGMYPMKWWGIAIFIVGPILLITGLELSFRLVNSREVLHWEIPGKQVTYVWQYLPAAIMVIASLLLTSFAMSVLTTVPYHALRQGRASAKNSVLMNYVSQPAPEALRLALRRKHWPVVFASLTAIIASFLVIVVGGLFTVEWVSVVKPIEFTANDTFSPSFFGESNNTIPGISASLIILNNVTYPDKVYGDLVLPRFARSSTPSLSKAPDNLATFNLRIPVLQPQISCDTIPSKGIEVEVLRNGNSTTFGPAIAIPLLSCAGLSPFGDAVPLKTDFDAGTIPPNGYFGGVRFWGGCPNFFVVFGKAGKNSIEDVSALGCTGWVSEIQASFNFTFNNFTSNFTISKPPEIHLETSRNISNVSLSILQPLFGPVDLAPNGSTSAVGSFLQAAIYGVNGVRPEDLLGRNGTNTSRLENRVAELYRLTAAQYIDRGWRRDINSTSAEASAPENTFHGFIEFKVRPQLKQNMPETRILDSLLGAIFICVLATYILIWPGRAIPDVPKNPHAIASVASLFAGSRLMRDLQGTGSIDPWAGKTFSLEEWTEEGGRLRFGIDQDNLPQPSA